MTSFLSTNVFGLGLVSLVIMTIYFILNFIHGNVDLCSCLRCQLKTADCILL